MTKNKNKLTLINFDLKGNQTIIRSKYGFIIKLLNWLGQRDYITIDYVSPETEPEVKLKIESTPSKTGIPHSILDKALKIRSERMDTMLRKRLENGMKTHYTKKTIKPAGKTSLKKKLPIKKNGSK